MPEYDFIATDHHGRNFKGSLSGATEQSVYNKLQKLGYVVLSMTKKEKRESAPLIIIPVNQEDIVIFSKMLSSFISAGLPINEALIALEEQIDKYVLKRAIREVRTDVETGMSLSNAISRHPKVFPNIFVSMIRSAEISGNLPDVLERLSTYLQRDQDIRRSVKNAFMYPKVVMLLAAGAITYLLRFTIPQFMHVYDQLNLDNRLSTPTQVLMICSKFFVAYGLYLLGAAVLLVTLAVWLKFNPSTRPFYERFIMGLPVFGKVLTRVCIARTVRSLGSMIECSVPIIDALETGKMVLDNKVIEEDIDRVIENVELGGNISTPLRLSKRFPPVVIYMIAAGERSGRLGHLLQTCAEAMEKELEHATKRLLFILEVGLIVMITVVIAFIAIAVYLPIFELVSGGPRM